jgi:hypothetical protein
MGKTVPPKRCCIFAKPHGVAYQKKVGFWRDSPQWARVSLFKKFLDHTQRRTTVGRTSLDE